MAKKTLKSLLGSSDEREQVEINLDDTQFRAPRVQAGQYSVRVQQPPRTNLAGQLANSLGRYAGPIARQYQNIETQRQEEFAEIAGLFTPEQAAAIQGGDTTEVQESLDKIINSLDSEQRKKKALKFVENPANYIRGSRVLGQKLAVTYGMDVQQNEDTYINSEEDLNTLIKNTRDDVIKNNNLTGYALEGFLEAANSYDARKLPQLQSKRDELTETNYITNSIDALVGEIELVEDGDFDRIGAEFSEKFKAYTPAEQSKYLETFLDRILTKGEYASAEEFVSWLATDEDGLRLGQDAALPEGTFNILNEKIEAHRLSRETHEKNVLASLQAKNDEAIQLAMAALNEGKPLENFILKFGSDPESQVEVNVEGVENKQQLLERTRSAIYSADLEPEANKGAMYATLTTQIEDIQTKQLNRYNNLGVAQLMGEYQSSLTLKVADENVLGITDEQALEMRFEAEQRLRDGIDEIQNDNETYPTIQSKVNAQKRLVEQTRLEFNNSTKEMFQTHNDTIRVTKVQNRVGLGVNGSFIPEYVKQRKAAETFDGLPLEPSVLRQINEQAKLERDRLLEASREIMTAPYSEEERKDLALAFENRTRQLEDLIDDSIYGPIEATTEDVKSESTDARAERTTVQAKPRDLTKVSTKLRYVPNFDGTLNDPPNGYTQDGIMFHPDGQNYRGKFPAGDLYKNGRMEHNKYKRLAKSLDRLRTKTLEQVEGERNIVATSRFEKRPAISFTAEKYAKALYGQRTAINGTPAVTVDEIRSGMLEGQIPFDPTKIQLNSFPILTPDMINDPDSYEDTILEYASALNIPREKVGAFLYSQAQALSSRGIIFETNINTQIEE